MKNLVKMIREAFKELERRYCLFCLETYFRSIETDDAKMYRILTQDIEDISSNGN